MSIRRSYEVVAANPPAAGNPAAAGAARSDPKRSAGTLVSAAIVVENFRRLWSLALVGLAVLLVSGLIALLLSSPGSRPGMLSTSLENANIGFVGYLIVFPMLIAVMLFRYLDSTGKTNTIHALPITRTALFASNMLSGLVLVIVPWLLLALSLLPFVRFGLDDFMSHATENNGLFGIDYSSQPGASPHDIGTLLRWLLVSVIVIAFVYALCVLASVITGNAGIAFVVAILLNIIAVALYFIAANMLRTFLFGFPRVNFDYADWLHPIGYLVLNGTHLDNVGALLVFLVVSVAAIIGAGMLYRSFRSERAGDAVAFRGFEFGVSTLVAFLGMCLLGFVFIAIDSTQPPRPSRGLFLVGAVIGGSVCFVVITMMLRKSTKIFTMLSLRRFGVFVVTAALFLTMTTVDVTGYEQRIPSQASVLSATANLADLPMLPYDYSFQGRDITLSDSESIAQLRALHGQILKQRSQKTNENSAKRVDSDWSVPLDIDYRLASGFALSPRSTLRREYTVDGDFLLGSEHYVNLLNSRGYRQANSINRMVGYENLKSFTVGGTMGDSIHTYSLDGISYGELDFDSKDAQTLAALLDEDYEALPAQSSADMAVPDGSSTAKTANRQYLLGLQFVIKNPHADGRANDIPGLAAESTTRSSAIGDAPSEIVFYYGVTKQYSRSIAWLKAKGYYERLVKASDKLMDAEKVQ